MGTVVLRKSTSFHGNHIRQTALCIIHRFVRSCPVPTTTIPSPSYLGRKPQFRGKYVIPQKIPGDKVFFFHKRDKENAKGYRTLTMKRNCKRDRPAMAALEGTLLPLDDQIGRPCAEIEECSGLLIDRSMKTGWFSSPWGAP